MIGINMNSLPHEHKVSYEMIRFIRLCKNVTQTQFSEACKMDRSVLAKIERGELPLSPHYEAKIMDGVRTLNINPLELSAVRKIVELKQNKGIN